MKIREGIIVALDWRFFVYPGGAGVDEGAGVEDIMGAGVEGGAGIDLFYTGTLFYPGAGTGWGR